MKRKIISATFKKEYETKFGTLYGHEIVFEEDGEKKSGFYSSKKKDQNKFIAGQESEFEIEIQMKNNKPWNKIKPIQQNNGFSNSGRSMQREQNKYSGFAMAYAKDLVVSGHIKPEQMFATAKRMIDWMVEQDKVLVK